MWYCQSLLETEVLMLEQPCICSLLDFLVLSSLGCPQPSLGFSMGLQK